MGKKQINQDESDLGISVREYKRLCWTIWAAIIFGIIFYTLILVGPVVLIYKMVY